MQHPGREWKVGGGSYRFGFNGKENDNEVKGEGNQQDYGMRIYNTRLVRFLSVDPLASSFAWNSSYSYAENDVIRAIDLDGAEKFIITDGDEPGTVFIQILNFEKRPAAFIGGEFSGTFTVEDQRKAAEYKGQIRYDFPIKSIQALYGGTFINDAGVVYQQGDASESKIAQEELGIDPSSKVYNTPRPIAMDAINSTLQEKQVIYAAKFDAGGAEYKYEPKYKLVKNKKQAISPLDTKTGSFGNGKTSVTRNYLAPKSDGIVNVSLLVGDGNSITNSFTVFDAKGNQLAFFQSTNTQHSTTLNFSVPSGSNFSVVVGGSATDKADNYSLTGSASTEAKTSYLAPIK